MILRILSIGALILIATLEKIEISIRCPWKALLYLFNIPALI